MIEIILTIHTADGPQSVAVHVTDEDDAIDFLRGGRLNALGEKASRTLTPSEKPGKGPRE